MPIWWKLRWQLVRRLPGVRPYRNGHDVMGRETFMLPVTWKENQPIILPEGDVITYTADRSYGPAPTMDSKRTG